MESPRQTLQDPFFAQDILDRFLRYVKIETTSDRHVEATPSTPGQWDLIRLLEKELAGMGIREVSVDKSGYLIARLPASPGREGLPCVGFMAHVDTASDVTAKDLRPRVHADYRGGRIELEGGIALDPADFPELEGREGDTLVSSDGRTLLGADDKAGLSEIMSAAAFLLAHPEIAHGPVELVFTPDEETGKGLPGFELGWLKSAACYTMDAGGVGETESECFNAWRAKAVFSGKVIHIGAARGKLANAVAMAADFIQSLPRSESPEATDGWYGYYCAIEVKGDLEKAECEVYLRDFEMAGIERRIEALKAIGKAVEARFPGGSVSIDFQKQYLNMKAKLAEKPRALELLYAAARENGIEPESKPIRGGTDGSRLTEMGIPTPNVFTGSYNMHSRREWASLSEMVLAARTVVSLIRLWGNP